MWPQGVQKAPGDSEPSETAAKPDSSGPVKPFSVPRRISEQTVVLVTALPRHDEMVRFVA